MKNTDFTKLTTKEASIMRILWESDKPLAVSEICEMDSDGSLNINSAQMAVKKLLEKKMVKVHSIIQMGKVFGRLYVPTMSAESYAIRMFKDFFERYTNRSVDKVIFTLLEQEENRDDIIDDLERALMKYKEKKETLG